MNASESITVAATSREAGRNVVHTVIRSDGGEVVRATRRSAHHYAYAICRWATVFERRVVIVSRWSNSSKATGRDFAVRVESI